MGLYQELKVWSPEIWAPQLRRILFKSVCYGALLELGGLKGGMHFPLKQCYRRCLGSQASPETSA